MTQTRRLTRSFLPSLLLAALLAACSGESPESMLASAKEYLAKKDSNAAVIQIKNALQKNPELAEARFLLGKALLERGDSEVAEVELRKALALKYSQPQIAPLLAKAMLAQGQAKKVVDEFGSLGGLPPDATAELQTLVATANAGLGKADDAERSIAAALAAKPDYSPALLLRARIKASAGDRAAAMAIVDAILAKTPADSDAQKSRGDILLVQGERDLAVSAYRKAIEAKADNAAAYAMLIDLLYAQNKTEEVAQLVEQLRKVAPKSLATTFQEARLNLVRKEVGKARDQIQQYLKVAPDSPQALQLAGSIEFESKSFAQAEIHFAKLVRNRPDNIGARRLLAMTYMKLGQPARALHTLEPVMGKIDGNASMLSLAGEVYLANGDAVRAEQSFKKATVLDPQNVSARTSLALTHLAKGDTGALTELETIAAGDSGTRADMALIASAMRQGQYDKALKAIDALQKKQADSPLPRHLRGAALLGKKDVAGARKSFESAVAIKPSYYPAAAALAGLDMSEKKHDAAVKRMEAVVAADPKNVEAYLALARLKARTGGSKEQIAELLNKAIAAGPTEILPRTALVDLYLRGKDSSKAVSAAQDAAAAIPDQPEIIDMLGRAQFAAGDSKLALSTFSKMAALRPGSPTPHLRMAELHLAMKDRELAMRSLLKALEVQPKLLDAQQALVELHASAGATDQAVRVAKEVQAQRPKEAIGHMLEGDARAMAKSWTEAAAAYRTGLKMSQAPQLAAKLYTTLVSGGNSQEAQRFASAWLTNHPKDTLFRLHLGDSATASNDYRGATTHYRAVVDIQPNHAVALNNLAWAAVHLKDPQAIEYAERANKLVPDHPAFMDTMAYVLFEKGDRTKAIELWKKASALAPEAYPIRMNLVQALIKTGDKDGARKELDSLAQMGDKGPKKEDIERVRKEL